MAIKQINELKKIYGSSGNEFNPRKKNPKKRPKKKRIKVKVKGNPHPFCGTLDFGIEREVWITETK